MAIEAAAACNWTGRGVALCSQAVLAVGAITLPEVYSSGN